ncbi:MAG: hypothetical protein HYY41_06960 [Chloroflexi bacterium]|nr:hypothetical protein [Chloroflexota bacterium]
MLKRILTVTIVILLLLLFSLGCSMASGLTGGSGRASPVTNPGLSTRVSDFTMRTEKPVGIWLGTGVQPAAPIELTSSSVRLTETETVNNANTFQVAAGPDLIVQSITWSPDSLPVGEIATFNVTVKNQGNDRALSSRLSFYVDGSFKSSQDIPMVLAGGVLTRPFTWTAEAGSHVIKIVADAENWVAESDESNNGLAVTVLTVPPDLIIQSLTWSPASPVQGDNVTFTVTIKNQGGGKAEPSVVGFYIDETNLAFVTVGALAYNATTSQTFNWFAQTGAHTVKAAVDPYNRIVESDESNNEKTITFPTLAPDFIVQSITWSPASPVVGETVTFTVTIKNQGNAGTTSFVAHLYVGNFFADPQDVQTLGVGGVVTKTFNWTAQAGSYVVKAVVDPYNKVLESNDSNNEKTVNFSGAPTPDLVIQGITWSPASPSVGEKMTITVTIKNQGKGIASNSYVAFYIDDVQLNSIGISSIGSGATDNETFTWTVEAGTHFIKVVADANEVIVEGDENNNERVIVYPVPADLVIQTITWLPANPSVSDNITFVVTVKNQGNVKADSFYIIYYIDGVNVAAVPVDLLDSGATDNKTATWIAEAGSHVIKVAVDPHEKVIESNEQNNEKSATFLVTRRNVLPTSPAPAPSPVPGVKPPETTVVRTEPGSSVAGESGWGLWLFALPVVFLVGVFIFFLKSQHKQD